MAAGFIPVSLILGATGAQAGLSPFTMGLMSGINFAGGSEFAAVALWSAVPPLFVVMMTTWLINSRHIMLSATLTPYVKRLSVAQALPVFFLMCDETWALAMQDISKRRKDGLSDCDAFSHAFYLGVGLTLWSTWVGSAVVGTLIGTGLGDMTAWGFAMTFPAIFISILGSMWPGVTKKLVPWGVSALAAGAASLWFGSAVCVAVGTAAGLAAVWFMLPEEEADHV